MQLTPHFTLEELLASETAQASGYTEQFAPDEQVRNNLKALAENVLEPLRIKANAVVHVSSGYRCPRLNKAVGGEPGSQHPKGEAADTTCEGMTVEEWYEFIKNAGIAFDQLIMEHDGHGNWWVHVSYSCEHEQRGECMKGVKLDGGGTACVADGFVKFHRGLTTTGQEGEQSSGR